MLPTVTRKELPTARLCPDLHKSTVDFQANVMWGPSYSVSMEEEILGATTESTGCGIQTLILPLRYL